jgi:hypothetical protein
MNVDCKLCKMRKILVSLTLPIAMYSVRTYGGDLPSRIRIGTFTVAGSYNAEAHELVRAPGPFAWDGVMRI